MKASLRINNHETGDYIAEGGISFGKEERVIKELVAQDGTKYQKKITKRTISVNLLDNMYDSSFQTFCSYLSPNPANVSYINLETGTRVSGTFYISDPSYSAKKTLANNITLLTGISLAITNSYHA